MTFKIIKITIWVFAILSMLVSIFVPTSLDSLILSGVLLIISLMFYGWYKIKNDK